MDDMEFPVTLKVTIYMTTDDRTIAKADIREYRGSIPSTEDLIGDIAEGVKRLNKQTGKKWRVCSKREFFDEIVEEVSGSRIRLDMPGKSEWVHDFSDTPA